MKRNIININDYKFLIEYYDCHEDLTNTQYVSEFVMLRNFSIVNEILHDNDIYFIEKKYFDEYINELYSNDTYYGNSIAFPITNAKIISFSNSYRKFNDTFNVYDNYYDDKININKSLYNIKVDKNGNENLTIGSDVYELYNIETDQFNNHVLKNAKVKCDKIRIYHPLIKSKLDAIIDISNYMNGINFHYLCKPINTYTSNSEIEIKFNNETYSEFIEIYFPNIEELFKVENNKFEIYYKENFNIVASSKNEKFINSIMSDSELIEHSELIDNSIQIVPINLFLQPYQIIEEYDTSSAANYNDTVVDDKKHFVKLYLKHNLANGYLKGILNIIMYPYNDIDNNLNLYILDTNYATGNVSICTNQKFGLMSRLGFNNGIISIITNFKYPNKSYFYNYAKLINDDPTSEIKTSPIKEAYKYYNNIDDKYYNMFINEELQKELEEIDEVESINKETQQHVKEVCNGNFVDKDEAIRIYKEKLKNDILNSSDNSISKAEKISEIERMIINNKKFEEEIIPYVNSKTSYTYKTDGDLLNLWKRIMKDTIIKEYEEEYRTPSNFLGFKIQISTDEGFKHIIYEKNVRINFNDLDDFSFNINGIFKKWEERPNKLLVKISFYDRLLGIELISNLVIITKEWFKYLINNSVVHRLTDLTNINNESDLNMDVINLNLQDEISKLNYLKDILTYDISHQDETEIINFSKYTDIIDNVLDEIDKKEKKQKINFINNIKCIVNKRGDNIINKSNNINQKIILKPIFYKANDLQNIFIHNGIKQKIGINLVDFMTKVDTFKIIINNKEYLEIGRNNIYVIFEIDANDINSTEETGKYNLIDESGNYISSGNWTLV